MKKAHILNMKAIPTLILLLVVIINFPVSLKAQGRLRVIYETDFSADWDDISAIALLHALADMGEAEILGCMINTSNEYAGRACDAVNTFYGRPDIPIGVYKGPDDVKSKSFYTKGLAMEFPNDLQDNSGVMEAQKLYRKILSEQPDTSVVIFSVGFNDNLEALLKTTPDQYSQLNGRELVKAKVRIIYIMGPYLEPYRFEPDADNFRKGFNFHFHHKSAKYVMDHWPTPVKIAEGSYGHEMFIGDELHGKPKNNPVRRAFELSEKTEDWDQHCADPSTIIYGAWDDDLFHEVTIGSCVVRAKDGWTKWLQNPDLDHYYNLPKLSINELEYLMDALLLKDPLPDKTSKIIYPAPNTVLFPGKIIHAKGIGKNLRWSLRLNTPSGALIDSGEGVSFDFVVPDAHALGDKLVLILQGDDGMEERTYDIQIHGLLGKYYHRNFFKYYASAKIDRKDYNWLNGAPCTFERVDNDIDFHWGNDVPDHLIGNDSTFSIVWTGYLKTEFSGTFTLYMKSSDGAKLFINDKFVIDDWAKHATHEKSSEFLFEAGRYYPVRIEYFAKSGNAEISLSWSGPGSNKKLIPQENLYVTH